MSRRNPGDDIRAVATSVDDLVDGARREPFEHDGKSGAPMERIVLDGVPYLLKHLSLADDWIMRATGDLSCRTVTLWRTGWLDLLPGCIDHTIVGAAWHDERREGAILMRDESPSMVPADDSRLSMEEHLRFLDHMARLHVAFWQRPDTIGLLPPESRFVWFGPNLAVTEGAVGGRHPLPTRVVPDGWERFARLAPRAAAVVMGLLADPDLLHEQLAETPHTLVHGDWKTANLGTHADDARTVLVDWALAGIAPVCADVAWYICLNCARLPHSKDETLAAYRGALERHGIDTEPWWEHQLRLCLLATMMLFGWEKGLGEGEEHANELAWWEAGVCDGAAELR
ncbi:MAG: phosphotransferase [Acidimicrobiales bacterium]